MRPMLVPGVVAWRNTVPLADGGGTMSVISYRDCCAKLASGGLPSRGPAGTGVLCVAGSFDKMKDFFDTSETDTILQFIRDELDDVPDDHIEVDTPLFRSRLLDSMNLLSLITFLEARFAIAISSADVVFENLDSVQHIVAFVARKRAIIPSA